MPRILQKDVKIVVDATNVLKSCSIPYYAPLEIEVTNAHILGLIDDVAIRSAKQVNIAYKSMVNRIKRWRDPATLSEEKQKEYYDACLFLAVLVFVQVGKPIPIRKTDSQSNSLDCACAKCKSMFVMDNSSSSPIIYMQEHSPLPIQNTSNKTDWKSNTNSRTQQRPNLLDISYYLI